MAAAKTDPSLERRWDRLALLVVGLLLIVAGASTVTLLEASVLFGEVRAASDAVAPGRLLLFAGGILVPSLLVLCGLLPWVLMALVREVNSRARAHRDLESARSLLERAEQLTQVGHWRVILQDDQPMFEWSDSIFRLLGYSPGDFVPSRERVLELYHPDDRDAIWQAVLTTIKTGKPFQMELRIVRRDGGVRTVVHHGVGEQSFDGKVGSVFGVVKDVTDEREQTHALAHQAERLRVITDGVSEGVVMLDPSNVVRFWNPAASELFGVSFDRAVGCKLNEIVRFSEPEHVSATLDLLPASDSANVRRVECADPRGRVRTLEITTTSLRGAGGNSQVLLVRDVTQRAKTERELQRQARFDELTGVFNRAYFWRRAAEEVDRARETGQPVSLLMLDIDHFKAINDERGHAEGDLALSSFARCCVGRIRSSDVMGRVGGEEFAVLLVGADAAQANQAAHKIRESIQQLRIEGSSGSFSVTVSVGVAQLDLEAPRAVEDAGRRADDALYRAKNAGRNQVQVSPLVRAVVVNPRTAPQA